MIESDTEKRIEALNKLQEAIKNKKLAPKDFINGANKIVEENQ